MNLFLLDLIGDPISLIPMKELANKVRLLLGSSDDSNDDEDGEPAWKRRGDCCERMLVDVKTKTTFLGETQKYGECRNCGATHSVV